VRVPTEQGEFGVHVLGGRGDWVICWPAQIGDRESLLEFGRVLAHDFRVMLIDPPGMGINQALGFRRSVVELAFFAYAVLKELGIERCHWVGHSAGGVVGAALHSVAGARIQSLTLASVPMLNSGRFTLSAAASTMVLSKSVWGKRILASLTAKELGVMDADEKSRVSKHMFKLFQRTLPETLSSLRPLEGTSVRHIFEQLRKNHPPMLVLTGRHDLTVLPRDQRTVAEVTQAQYVELPCGHMTLLAEPETSAHAFMRFAQRVDRQHQELTELAIV
jgi:pimeloyl-ACP methyl ester carboxylesterase